MSAEPASFTRDENGVPQIVADDLEGLHWGMGYCHAMDRGLQMLLMRILDELHMDEPTFGTRRLRVELAKGHPGEQQAPNSGDAA